MNKKRLITGLVLIGALLVSVSVVYAIAYYENDDFDRGDVSLLGNSYWASDRDDYIVAESAGDGFYKTFPTQQKQEDAWDVYVYVQDKDAGAFALV